MELAVAGVLAGCMAALWLLSLKLRDASIVDIFWGFGFVLVAGIGCWLGDGWLPRRELLLGLVGLWGLRLSGYLFWRNRGKGEDKRYAAMREAHGKRWWWWSLFQVFGLQGLLIYLVSWPVRLAMVIDVEWTAWDLAGAALVLLGVLFEAVGDFQLARFKARHRGKVMDRGLWRYTRHPNYFGDFCVWWGLYLVAMGLGAWWTLPAPLVMSFLLMRVSGVTMTEKIMGDRPGYADYVKRTSAFFPWPPGKAARG